jgi:hypothetical protein
MARFDIPRIAEARTLAPFKVAVTWDNGVSATVDLRGHLKRLAVFAPLLRDRSLWPLMKVDEELAYHLAWPDPAGGLDLEVPTDLLWRLHLEQSGQVMSPAAFAEWMDRHRLSLEGAAKALGISRRMAAYYKSGERLAPKTIMLACKGYESLAGSPVIHRRGSHSGGQIAPGQ